MTTMDESPTKRAVLELKKVEGNDECADCGRKGELCLYTPRHALGLPLDVCQTDAVGWEGGTYMCVTLSMWKLITSVRSWFFPPATNGQF